MKQEMWVVRSLCEESYVPNRSKGLCHYFGVAKAWQRLKQKRTDWLSVGSCLWAGCSELAPRSGGPGI